MCACVLSRLEPSGRPDVPREAETTVSAVAVAVSDPAVTAAATAVRAATEMGRPRANGRSLLAEVDGQGAAGPVGAARHRAKQDPRSLPPVTKLRVATMPDLECLKIVSQKRSAMDYPPISRGLVRAHGIVKEDRAPLRGGRSRPIDAKR